LNKASQLLLMIIADIIVLAVTLIIFFVGFGFSKTSFDYIALLFVLLSEVMLFAGSTVVSRNVFNSVFLRSGVLTTLSLYWIAATAFSLLHKFVFGQNITSLVVTQVIVLAIAALTVIGIVAYYLHSTNKSSELTEN